MPSSARAEMVGHALAIVRMDELPPLGSLHLAILCKKPEHFEELPGAIGHLILEIPLEGRHTAGALCKAQHLFR